jgi:large subunit ribosomal protein L21
MYAIVKIGASQYKVEEGQQVVVGKFPEEEGKTVTLDKVLLVANGNNILLLANLLWMAQPLVPK